MKKTLWIAMVGALVASVVAASAQEVLSANAVGYIKKEVPPAGDLVPITIPLEAMDSVDVIFTNSSVASEAENGSIAYFWSLTNQEWQSSTKSTKDAKWGGAAVGKAMDVGEMFFLKSPATAVAAKEVTITGQVPPTNSPVEVWGQGNLTAIGNPYPVDFVFTNSSLASGAANGSLAYFWDPTGQAWMSSTKSTKDGTWGGAAIGRTISAGEGFFLKDQSASATRQWSAEKLYTWP